MSVFELVKRHLARLHDCMNGIGVDKNSGIFHEWANGRVLLDARTTREAMSASIDGDYGQTVIAAQEALREVGETQLKAALVVIEGNFVICVMHFRS